MGITSHFGSKFEDACQLATDGQLLEAQQEFQALLAEELHSSHTPETSDFSYNHQLLQNNIAAVEAALGDLFKAKQSLKSIACHDFEIVATADPVGQVNEYTKFIGWQSQESLPAVIQDCDMLVFPTIAQEALGRTAVEAMGCGRPVIASDIGGLSWVVEHGVTGLLCEAGNPHDLAAKCSQLLDDHASRIQFGINGRKKFERDFTWNQIIKNHYLKLFGSPISMNTSEHSVPATSKA